MAFWSEQFKKPGGEDIWEELRQMLLNPPTEEEKALKKQEEQAWIDSILDKAFPDKPKPQSEPYLTYEDLLLPEDAEKYRQKQMALAQGKESTKRNPYEEINSHSDWSEELKAQKRAEIAKIQETARQREREINIENAKEHAKNFGGASLEIGSMAVPGMLQKKIATQAIKMGKPLTEQVIKKSLQRGAIEGTLSGALEGLGSGIREDENILKSTAKGAAVGGITGTMLGKIAGEAIAGTSKIKNLDELLDKRKDWGIAFTKQSGKPAEAIEKLLEQKKGFVPKATNKKGIGDIDFVWGKQDYNTGQGYGFEHIIDGRTKKNKIDGVEFVKSLPETIAEGIVKQDSKFPNNNYIEDLNNKIAVPNNWLGKERNWVLTAHPQNKSASKRLATSAPMSKPNVDSRYNNFTTELTADNNIISSSQNNLNSLGSELQNNLSQNLAQSNTIQPPKTDLEWREWLRHKRKQFGW